MARDDGDGSNKIGEWMENGASVFIPTAVLKRLVPYSLRYQHVVAAMRTGISRPTVEWTYECNGFTATEVLLKVTVQIRVQADRHLPDIEVRYVQVMKEAPDDVREMQWLDCDEENS